MLTWNENYLPLIKYMD